MIYSSHKKILLASLIVCYILLIASYSQVTPLWDAGRFYRECISPTFQSTRTVFTCLGHILPACAVPYRIVQKIDPTNIVAINLLSCAWGVLAIFSFYKLMGRVFPRIAPAEHLLWTALLAFSPTFVASSLHVTCDYNIIALFTLVTWLLIAGYWRWATLAGLLLVFSKEHGLVLYSLLLGSVVAINAITRSQTSKSPDLFSRLILFIPIILFATYYLSLHSCLPLAEVTTPTPQKLHPFLSTPTSWYQNYKAFFQHTVLDAARLSKLAIILVLNFNWIYLAIILAYFSTIIFRVFTGKPSPDALGKLNYRSWLLILSVTVLGLYISTAVSAFLIPRYFLWLHPLLLVCAYRALIALVDKGKYRIGVTVFTLGLVICSNFRSFDPVSRAIFGSFEFGKHRLLKLTSLMDPTNYFVANCGYGTDNLVYNLEFTEFEYLTNLIMQDLRPTTRTTFVSPAGAAYTVNSLGINRANFQRSLNLSKTLWLNHLSTQLLIDKPNKPQQIFFLAFPNFPFEGDLELLDTDYRITNTRLYQHRGYEMQVYEMRRR